MDFTSKFLKLIPRILKFSFVLFKKSHTKINTGTMYKNGIGKKLKCGRRKTNAIEKKIKIISLADKICCLFIFTIRSQGMFVADIAFQLKYIQDVLYVFHFSPLCDSRCFQELIMLLPVKHHLLSFANHFLNC